jgi:hypothetical protein
MTFGPWAPDLDPAERAARFRALAALAAVYCGGSSAAIVTALRGAEQDDTVAMRARAMFDALPALSQRRALATYAAVHRATRATVTRPAGR